MPRSALLFRLSVVVSKKNGRAVLLWGGILLLLFAPLFQASNSPVPRLILESGALALLGARLWPVAEASTAENSHRSGAAGGFLSLLLLYPLIYLVPILSALPGRALYAEGLMLLGEPTNLRPVSLLPFATESAWLVLLPPLAVLLSVLVLSIHSVRRLVRWLIGIAVFEAILGLMQYGAGSGSFVCLGNPVCSDRGVGTYVNADHLAGMLEMVLPMVLGLLAATAGHDSKTKHYRRSWRERFLSLSTWRTHVAAWYGICSVAILLGLIFTRSRAGIGLAMVGIFLTLVAFAGRLGGRNIFGWMGTIVAVGIGLAVEIGLTPVLQRFAEDPLKDGRWRMVESALEGVGQFSPVGSGPGTFPELYDRFRPLELGQFFNHHAHNDYVEWLFEGGVVSLMLIVWGLGLYVARWPKVWCRGEWSPFRFIQVGAGIGLFLIALHGLVDFNWHIPANALYTAFLAAVFFHRGEPPVERSESASDSPRQPRTSSPPVIPLPKGDVPNPFADPV